jgi:hypothetical protein
MKQTAVEWLEQKIKANPFRIENDRLWNEAKEMEKEKMCKFAYKCHNHYKVYGDFKIEEYYDKTFKSK